MTKEDIIKKQAFRDVKFFNFWRKMYQMFVSHIVYMTRFKLIYRLEVYGQENIPTDNEYIIASNHLSTLDPPLMGAVFNRPIAYMAKKELFENPLMRIQMNLLGGFAVDREKLSVSTIKTALSIKKTEWVLGIFPQGTREPAGKITLMTKGFATLAKASKCGIMPVGIIGTDKAKWIPFSGKIIVRIGEKIPYSDNLEEMEQQWIDSITKLTGFVYEPKE